MKLGLGLYRHLLTRENFQFARQAGATHIVAHLVDYFKGGAKNPRDNQPTGTDRGWGLAGDPEKLWSVDELLAIRKNIEFGFYPSGHMIYFDVDALKQVKADLARFYDETAPQS